ncbi:uncharacterized protein KY384_004507 [Bacidia gigantensis]|uniref:uncharacterized protein n=1 Tax=Bacidia gigantensis TaxID=2732470 RepID=UPI001D05AC86|nr:uncharacterized protein KY384_004507 [Bacidia gigantensis]KAG8531149.1 hypothetical protein KY384_004507 [Bacidia gigantensis]
MNASAWYVGRAASRHVRPNSCRFIAGRRLPRLRSAFHTSLRRRRSDAEDAPSQVPSDAVGASSNIEHTDGGQPQVIGGSGDVPEKPSRPKDASNYGSASRRAGRNIRRPKELPQPYIPHWFLDRNVVLKNDVEQAQDSSALPNGEIGETSLLESQAVQPAENQTENAKRGDGDGTVTGDLKISPNVVEEVTSVIQAGLWVPSREHAELTASIRPHLVLSCPRAGGSRYLDQIVRDIARQSNSDILRLSAQDIAEIGGDYMEGATSFNSSSLSTIGYDVAGVSETRPSPAAESTQDEAEEYDEDGEDEGQEFEQSSKAFPPTQLGAMSVSILPRGAFSLGDLSKFLKFPLQTDGDSSSQVPKVSGSKSTIQIEDNTPDMKMSMLIDTLLNAPDLKRLTQTYSSEPESSGETPPERPPPNANFDTQNHQSQGESSKLIVIVEDYPQINMTLQGSKVLSKLHSVVDGRRSDGQSVLIVGTASSDRGPTLGDHKAAIDNAQTQSWEGEVRTIVVPIEDSSVHGRLWSEHKRRTREINLRHLRHMLRRTSPNPTQVSAVVDDWRLPLESQWAFVTGLDQSIWSLDKVNRIAVVALGLLNKSGNMSSKTIEAAFETIDASDNSKYEWWKKHMNEKQKGSEGAVASAVSTQADSENRIRKLRKKSNAYEKKLLSGVIDAQSIRTTFADVQAPQETIEALKTLTSLSLIRPDAFTYGVLATDRIPGLLLYGPPGTGKTLLAKAVAKESGATMLEISGSDVYDMYVGEGEKNVKAIFTLAKKLSPCVVFIDEADAILGSRSSGQGRTSHRELINQFLREWDGVTDMNAFIMVATNRPFDLDEASLRRLPRRLLVDLPVEKDREVILNIHLKDELLEPQVSIPQLATQTPFYSGSDLKNLCVAAALACVREESESAAEFNKQSPDEIYQYAEKRTLCQRHFTKATEEISASISEDMGSLSAIRKFDEKYGDRRGRRKKLGGYGFKTVDDSEKLGSDNARVRNRT